MWPATSFYMVLALILVHLYNMTQFSVEEFFNLKRLVSQALRLKGFHYPWTVTYNTKQQT
jgi:hypothetical protein